ncbi:MAG: c-type cytochrome [Hyphomicrobiaceae bacterium]
MPGSGRRAFAACAAFAAAVWALSAAPAASQQREAPRRANAGSLTGHGGPIKAIRVDPATGRALTGSFDYAMMVWDVSGEEPKRLLRLDGHEGAVNAVAFVPGGTRALAAGNDGAVALWDLATGRLVHRFIGHQAKVVGLAVSADGGLAASAAWDRTVRIWDLMRLAAGPVLGDHKGPVNAVAFSADGTTVYTGSADGGIGAYNAADGTLLRSLYRHGWGINVLERLPDGDRLLFGAHDGAVAVVDGRTGDGIRTLKSHDRPVLALAILEKPNLVATGGGDGTIRVMRAADGAVIEEYQNAHGPVWALAFSGGTRMYYGGLDDFAALWHVVPRRPFETVEGQFPRRFQATSGARDDPLAAGEVQFARKCSVCHTLEPDGANRAGPSLFGIFGRRIGSLPSYPYSDALKKLDIVWSEETVGKLFELGPDTFTPGSKMPLQKILDAGQRAALIAYLKAVTTGNPTHKGERQ